MVGSLFAWQADIAGLTDAGGQQGGKSATFPSHKWHLLNMLSFYAPILFHRGKTDTLADLLLAADLEARVERLTWLLNMKVQQAPSDDKIGFGELLQMDDHSFTELYPEMAWTRK
jgi:hypothetical protein